MNVAGHPTRGTCDPKTFVRSFWILIQSQKYQILFIEMSANPSHSTALQSEKHVALGGRASEECNSYWTEKVNTLEISDSEDEDNQSISSASLISAASELIPQNISKSSGRGSEKKTLTKEKMTKIRSVDDGTAKQTKANNKRRESSIQEGEGGKKLVPSCYKRKLNEEQDQYVIQRVLASDAVGSTRTALWDALAVEFKCSSNSLKMYFNNHLRKSLPYEDATGNNNSTNATNSSNSAGVAADTEAAAVGDMWTMELVCSIFLLMSGKERGTKTKAVLRHVAQERCMSHAYLLTVWRDDLGEIYREYCTDVDFDVLLKDSKSIAQSVRNSSSSSSSGDNDAISSTSSAVLSLIVDAVDRINHRERVNANVNKMRNAQVMARKRRLLRCVATQNEENIVKIDNATINSDGSSNGNNPASASASASTAAVAVAASATQKKNCYPSGAALPPSNSYCAKIFVMLGREYGQVSQQMLTCS